MPAILQKAKVLSVRLPAQDIRRLKSTAAARGISVQDAVRTAVESWLSNSTQTSEVLDDFLSLQGSLSASPDVDTLRRQERELEFAKDNRWS